MIVSCVCVGNKYSTDYVYKLRDMVARHLQIPHTFVCHTDAPGKFLGILTIDVRKYQLNGWWNKMLLFSPIWRGNNRVIYFDLDTVICNDLLPLAKLEIDFGICGNFTRASGNLKWPCNYGSCVMTIGPNKCDEIYNKFCNNSLYLMHKAGNLGDQKVIEELKPNATLLQNVLPNGYFLGYRDIRNEKPENCSIVVFAGKNKPDNCQVEWIKKEWVRS